MAVLLVFFYQASGASAYVVWSTVTATLGAASLRNRPAAKAGVELQTARDAKKRLKEAAMLLRSAAAGTLDTKMRASIERRLDAADALWNEYLAARRARLGKKGATEIHDLENQITERGRALRVSIEDALNVGTQTELSSAAEKLEASLVPPEKIPAATPMPFSMRPMAPKAKTTVDDELMMTAAADIDAGAVTSASGPPTAADLADAVDAPQCPEVVALANSLGGDPLKLYEYVRHRIDYEPYYGLRKGACETLLSLSGNSFDHASLLIAMLRASGIPARFATGTVEIPAAEAAGMMGLDDASIASTMIQTSAIPGTSIIGSGGETIAVRMERAWVEAYVPYTNYRGVPNSAEGPTWIPLDPSFKQFVVTPAIDLGAASGLDVEGFNATMAAASTFDSVAGQVVGIDQTVVEHEADLLVQTFNDTIDATFGVDQATGSDVLGSKVVVAQSLGMLPSSLPYQLKDILTEGAVLPASLRYSLTVQVGDASFTTPMAALNSQPLTVAWPAISGTPPPDSIFSAIPTIRLGGLSVATGSSVNTGSEVNVTLTYAAPNQAAEQIFTTREAGETLAIVLDLGRMVPEATQAASDAMEAATVDLDRVEWMLTTAGRTYFMELDASIEMNAAFNGFRYLHEVFGGIVSEVRNTEFAFGIPVGTSYAGMNIDVARQLLTPFSKVGDPNAPRMFMLGAGLSSSAMEHAVFNQLLQARAVSTTQILSLANQAAVPVYRIDASNAGTIVPLLTHPASMIATVNLEIASGRVVTIPRDPISYFDWSGTGYITEDPATGAAAYIISGGLSGYVTTRAGGDIAEILACIGAIVEVIDLIPIPGWVGVAFDIAALPAGLYDIARADVSDWRKAIATGAVVFSLLGVLGAIPTPPTIIIGVLADVIAYVVMWAALGGGNPFDPCFASTSRRQDRGSAASVPAVA